MTGLTASRQARGQARLTNARTYQGQDCDNAHGGTRYTSNGQCVQCAKGQRRAQADRLRDERESAGNPMRAAPKPTLSPGMALLDDI